MSSITKNNKKVTINTASVKVQFMTSSKDFTATMAKYWVAINEMADKALILRKNLKVCKDWAELNKDNPEKQAMYESEIAGYQSAYDSFKEEYNKRINTCYELIPDELYTAYTTSEEEFKQCIKEWFSAQKIEATPTLISFMTISVGYKNSSNKQLFKTGNALSYKTKPAFNKSFLNALTQLMKDKNALKTDAYKYQYKEPEKKKKTTTK